MCYEHLADRLVDRAHRDVPLGRVVATTVAMAAPPASSRLNVMATDAPALGEPASSSVRRIE